MKRLTIILLALLLFATAFADNEVTMVSYEQSAYEPFGTLALKNNTQNDINSVQFRIIYFDMSGTQLDYEDFSEVIDLAPGLTKKISIPAYEHKHYYEYAESNKDSRYTKFKIEYQLLSYNKDVTDSEDSYVPDGFGYFGFILLIIIIVISASIGFYILVAIMAKKRNRNVAVWVLLSIFATPVLMAVILLCIGDSEYYEEIG